MLTSPRGPSAGEHGWNMKSSPAAVEWWDSHVYRTHLRSPITSRPGTPREMAAGLSPRSLRSRGHGGVMLPSLQTPRGSSAASSLMGSYPPFAHGSGLSKGLPAREQFADPMRDTVPMARGGCADHPLKVQLSQVYKGMKMLDHDGDGHLAPNDIVRGLGAFNLSVGSDKDMTAVVNELIMKCMSNKGMVHFSKFVYALAANPKVCAVMVKNLDSIKAKHMALAAAASSRNVEKPKGPTLRPTVTANELRQAVSFISSKLMDKHSSLTAAFRYMDKDGSGFVSRGELVDMIHNLNLSSIRQPVIDTLIDFIDVSNDLADDIDEGSTDIGYREFARAFTADDIMSMAALAPSMQKPAGPPPPTPPPQNLTASAVASVIMSKFKPDQMRSAFAFLDKDRTNKLSRSEIKRTLNMWGMLLTEAELDELFQVCDKDGNGSIDYEEFCQLVARNPAAANTRSLVKGPSLRAGVREVDLRKAQHVIRDTFLRKFGKYTDAFKYVDRDRTGSITRDELNLCIQEFNLVQLKPVVIENLIDFIDIDPTSSIEYREFARVLAADDVMQMAPLTVTPAQKQVSTGFGRHKMSDMPGAQGISWTNHLVHTDVHLEQGLHVAGNSY